MCIRDRDKLQAKFETVTSKLEHTQFPRLIIQNFNLAYDLWVFEFNLAYDPWVFEFKICKQFQVFPVLHCDSHPAVQKPKFGP